MYMSLFNSRKKNIKSFYFIDTFMEMINQLLLLRKTDSRYIKAALKNYIINTLN